VKTDIDSAESPAMLSHYLSRVIQIKLSDKNLSVEERTNFINKIITLADADSNNLIKDKRQILSEVKDSKQQAIYF
jgi:hypothetical protein